MLRHRLTIAALASVMALPACGGDDGDSGDSPERSETPAAQSCPPQVAQAQEDAAFAMKSDDFDAALATLKPYLDCPEVKEKETEYRAVAAKTSLRIARKHLATAQRTKTEDNSPQAAVSLARNSLRYKDTPEGREFLVKAEAALAAFKKKYGPKPDEEAGGPPEGAGEGGPPEGAGGE